MIYIIGKSLSLSQCCIITNVATILKNLLVLQLFVLKGLKAHF
jgi:hypothetical protein